MGSIVYDLSLGKKDAVIDYTYKDIKIDVKKTNSNRDIEVSKDFEAINNGIYNLFLFELGERIINPEFGNSLYKYLYEPINDGTAQAIGEEILNMFENWEPRVNILNILITPDEDANTYSVEITYNVPSLRGEQILSFNTALNARR